MSEEAKKEQEKKVAPPVKLPKKKRKTEPEVVIGPTGPGGPDISIE